jgi:hypothetical protein
MPLTRLGSEYNLGYKLGYTPAAKKRNEINPMAASWLRSERTISVARVPLEEFENIRNSKGEPVKWSP